MDDTTRLTVARLAIALTLASLWLQLGGSLYEALVLDTAWPTHPALIQPELGGADRKTFWIPVHGLASLALPVALWAAWRARPARAWLLGALVAYIAIRAWTFVYFIPAALRFEAPGPVDPDAAQAWVLWSLGRAPLLVAATWAATRARAALGRTPHSVDARPAQPARA